VSQARIHQIQTEVAHDQVGSDWTAAVARVHQQRVEVAYSVPWDAGPQVNYLGAHVLWIPGNDSATKPRVSWWA
jgi:hypothetical protein